MDDNDIFTCLYPNRHIQIKPYYGDENDTELLKLIDILWNCLFYINELSNIRHYNVCSMCYVFNVYDKQN